MKIAIAGGNGKIGRELTGALVERGDDVLSLIRKPEQSDAVRELGAEPVLCDLEHVDEDGVARAIAGADAVVFAAGAGPGSGPERKETMDYGGAVKLIGAAKAAGAGHYVMVSSMGADPSIEGEETFQVYLRAKGRADKDLVTSGLAYTIVRPGPLNDDAGTGLIAAGEKTGQGAIPRADVAAVVAAVLAQRPSTPIFELVGGSTPIDDALALL